MIRNMATTVPFPARALRTARTAFTVAADVLKERRALRRAAAVIPRPIPWEWAAPRLLPLLAGPSLDQPGEERLRSTMDPGCAVEFGVRVEGTFLIVDAQVAERWECSRDQIAEIAMQNLRARAGRLVPGVVTAGTLSGRIVRMIRGRVSWASSLLLVPPQLIRLFGGHDQIFAAPGRSIIISIPIDTPERVAAEIVVDMESLIHLPLLLDPFALVDGRLTWQDLDRLDE